MSKISDALAPAKVTLELPVLWGNQDAFGHVNNTIFFLWFESARIHYLHESNMQPIMDEHGVGPILAAIQCNYRKQVKFPDRVAISARVTEMGRTSMKMAHEVYSHAHQALVADGLSTVVPVRLPGQQAAADFPGTAAAHCGVRRAGVRIGLETHHDC